MIKRIIRILPLLLIVMVAFTSCKSAPEEAGSDETPVVTPAAPVEEPVVVPAEPNEEVPAVTFTEDEKNDLLGKVAAARTAAVAASADSIFPEEFAAVDAACAEALAAFEADGDAAALKEAAKDAIRMYKTLENAALAEAEFNRIVDLGFDADNPAAFDAACEMAENLRAMAADGASPAELLAASESLLGSYRGILDASFKKRADAQRQEYIAVEKQAKGIKAEVSRKADFAAAHQLCVDGDAAYACTSYEQALSTYRQATDKMTAIFTDVSQKRAGAQAAIDAARARAAAAEQVALEADEIAPLPEDAEGFEEPEDSEESTSSYELLGVQEDAE